MSAVFPAEKYSNGVFDNHIKVKQNSTYKINRAPFINQPAINDE